MGKSKETQRTSSSNTFDPWVNTHAQSISGRANELGSRGFNAFQGPINAQYGGRNYTGLHAAAGQSARGQLQTPMSHLEGQQFDAASAQPFIDQYYQAAQPGLADIQDQTYDAINASRSGGFGNNSRQQVVEGLIARNSMRAKGDLLSNAINQGMGMGFGAHQAHQQNIQNAAGIRQGQIQGALGAANTLQGLDQAALDRNREEYRYNRDQPWREMGYETSVLGGLPRQTYNQGKTTVTKPSAMGPALVKGIATIGGAALGGPIGAAIGGGLAGAATASNTPLPKPRPPG